VAGETFTQEQVDAMIAERVTAEVSGLKANREEALREAKAAKAALKSYEGVDAEEFKRLKAASLEAEQKKAAAEGDFNVLKKQLLDQHATEKQGLEAKMAKYAGEVEKRAVQAALIEAITAEKGNAKMLLPYAKQFVRVRETDDGFDAYVADEKGNQMIGDAQGAPMSIKQFVQTTLKTEFPGAFEGTGSSGGGATKSIAGGGGQKKTISLSNPSDLVTHAAAIASGEMTVTQ
jgi:hypothetical protein